MRSMNKCQADVAAITAVGAAVAIALLIGVVLHLS
jgi:hypothetical protein